MSLISKRKDLRSLRTLEVKHCPNDQILSRLLDVQQGLRQMWIEDDNNGHVLAVLVGPRLN